MTGISFHTDVLITGAGAAGLTLAIDLARRGVSFRIVDKLPEPFQGSRGKGIQPRSQEILEDLGVLDRIVAIGGTYPPQREYRDDRTYEDSPIVEPVPPTPDEPYHIALLVPQFLTERVLRERLAELGHAIEIDTELVHFEDNGRSVIARLRTATGEETVTAQYLIGCDGGRSSVRQALDLDFPGKTLGVRAIVADAYIDGLGREAWHRWHEGDMKLQTSICPLAGTDLFQIQAPVPMEGDVEVSAESLTKMIHERTGWTEIVVRKVTWGSVYTMNARLANRYKVGRILLAGDAAHIHPPTGGQGLNTSMQDAYNLGWKLAAVIKGGPSSLLETYEAERRPIAEQMLGLSTRLLQAAKDGAYRRGREVHQLDIGYPGSPLAFERPERTAGLLAGDRAPDAPMSGAAGQGVRLFSLMKGPHFTAIGYEAARDKAPEARAGLHVHRIGADGDLKDSASHFAAAYSPSPGSWFIIRPDGYIGAIIEQDCDGMEFYLRSVGLGKSAC